jgi:hypothetical protein
MGRYEYIGIERFGGFYKIDRLTGKVYFINAGGITEVKGPKSGDRE